MQTSTEASRPTRSDARAPVRARGARRSHRAHHGPAPLRNPQFVLNLAAKLVVVLFAGAGGSCTGIEKAIGRPVDIAANHNEDALSCHKANHPHTRHYREDVRALDPRELTGNQAVGYLHLSPDCTHFSQAKGGQPRSTAIRSLPWVTVRWAGTVRPEVITLENVKEIRKWGPLIAKRDPETGRVLKLVQETVVVNGKTKLKTVAKVAEPGERVPVQQQFLIPDPKREGKTWRKLLAALRALGYAVEDRVLMAADYDVPQKRRRLFMIARCDGRPIVWPEPVRHEKPKGKQRAWIGAHECLDFTVTGTSIFDRKKPLAPATMKRIARGVDRFVLKSADPFLISVTHTKDTTGKVHSIRESLPVVTTAKGGEFALAAPVIVPATHQGDARVHGMRGALPTITGANRGELMMAAPIMIQAGHGEGRPDGVKRWGAGTTDVRRPPGVVTASGGGQAVAAALLVPTGYGERDGQAPRVGDIQQPLGVVVGAGKHALVAAQLAAAEPPRQRAAAFMDQANGGYNDTPAHDVREPVSTIVGKGTQQRLVAASLVQLRNNCAGRDMRQPLQVVSAGGEHHGLVAATLVTNTTGHGGTDMREPAPTVATGGHHALVEVRLSPEAQEGALRCAAFLREHYGNEVASAEDPLAPVTVWIEGCPYVIVDICLRMLLPRELARATSLPDSYILERGHDGRRFTKSQQVKMIGNAVPPELQYYVTAANYQDEPVQMLRAA